jgi:S1-C subfamily serine protease
MACLLLSISLLFASCQTSGSSTSGSGNGSQTGNSQSTVIPSLNSNNIEAVREAVIAKVRPAVVQITVALSGNKGAIGSGDIIDQRGYIVTNNHVINGAQSIQVTLFDGTQVSGQTVGTDPADDLAVIKINVPNGRLSTMQFGDSSRLQVGQEVLAIGNPLGITQTVTNGIVSALNRTVSEGQGGATLPNAIQTDAPINPGNSGGALVDLQGNLIGIPTLTAIDPEFNTPANGVGFAIPSNRVEFIAQQIIQTGRVEHSGRAALSIKAISVDQALAAQANLSVNQGALVVSVVPNGPAAQAGIKPGDVIVQVDNQAINDVSSLTDVLLSKNPGQKVSVRVYRGSQQMTFNVTLGELTI